MTLRAVPHNRDTVPHDEDAFLAYVAEVAEEHPEYLVCRTSQHRWPLVLPPLRIVDSRVEVGEYTHRGENTYAKRVQECDRCGAKRFDYFKITSRRGHQILRKLDARYDLPPGYATKGLGRVADTRGLILGIELQSILDDIPTPKRGRPKKEQRNA